MSPSMHRGAVAPFRGPGHPLALGKKRGEDGQDCLLAGFNKGAAGDLLGVPQDVFGFGQFVHTASLPRGVFRGIPFFWNRHEHA